MKAKVAASSKFRMIVIGISLATLLALLVVAVMSRSVIQYRTTAKLSDPTVSDAEQIAQLEERTKLDSADVDAHTQLAQADFEKGQYATAAQRWSQVSSLSPLDTEPLYQKGRSLYLAGDLQQSDLVLSDKRLEDHAGAGVIRARISMARGDLKGAKDQLTKLIQAHPNDEDALLLQADLYVGQNKIEMAELNYKKLVGSTRPEIKTGSALGRAQVALRGNNEAAALEILDGLAREGMAAGSLDATARLYIQAKAVDQGLALFDSLIEKYGARTPWVVEIAEQKAGRKDRKAIMDLRASMTEVDVVAISGRYYLDALVSYMDANCNAFLDAISWAKSHQNRPLAVWLRLNCAASEGDFDSFNDAVAAVNLNFMAEPLKQQLQSNLMRYSLEAINKRNSKLAVEMAKLAIKLDIDRPGTEMMLARALLADGKNEAAIEISEKYLSDFDQKVVAHEVKGRALLGLNQPTEAEITFAQLVNITDGTAKGLGYYWWGVAAQKSENLDAAEQRFELAFQNDYRDKAGVALLGIYLNESRWADAKATADWFITHEDVVRQAVGNAYLAAIAAGQKEYIKAAQRYVDAIALTPERMPFYLRAADNYIAGREFAAAEEVLNSALKREPTNKYVKFKLAYAAEQSEQQSIAIQRYRRLIVDEPQWALPIYNLASILADDDSTLHEAYRLSSRAYSLNPNWTLAAELFQELGRQIDGAAKAQTEGQSS